MKLLLKSKKWAGVMVKRIPDLCLEKKKKLLEDGQVLQEFLLMSSVSLSGQYCRYRVF